jgi:hypothetical protein
MILAIAVALLQIRAIPQTKTASVSAYTAETALSAAPDTGAAASSDGANVATSAPPFESLTPAALYQGPSLSGRSAFADPAALSPLPDRHRKLQRREWLALSTAQHGAATFDAWSTRRVISSGQGQELNPLLRPFAGNGSLYAVMQVGPVALDYLGKRMMTSRHEWVRRTWWVPQVVSTVVSLASGAHNLSVR